MCRTPLAPSARHVSLQVWTACSQSSSDCATHSTGRRTSFSLIASIMACTATRVFPAPVGREMKPRQPPSPRMSPRNSAAICVWNGCSGRNGGGPGTSISGSRAGASNPAYSSGKPSSRTKVLAATLPAQRSGGRSLASFNSDRYSRRTSAPYNASASCPACMSARKLVPCR